MNDSIIRTRYADALVKYVRETGNGESVCQQAERLARVLREVPDLSRMIAAKDVVSADRKRELLRAALGEPMTPELSRFIDLLLENGRIGALRMILRTVSFCSANINICFKSSDRNIYDLFYLICFCFDNIHSTSPKLVFFIEISFR